MRSPRSTQARTLRGRTPKARTRLGAGAATGLLFAILLGGPAFAAQSSTGDDGTLVVRRVDATQAETTTIDFSWTGDPAAVEGLQIAEDGEEVQHEPAAPITPDQAIVLAVDVSEAMRGQPLVQTKAALTAWLDERPANSQVALVTFAEETQLVVGFTGDVERVKTAIADLAASGPTGLYNGVATAAEAMEDAPTMQHNVLLVSGGPDTGSATTSTQARSALGDANAALYAIGTASADAATLQSLVASAGGTFTEAPPADLGAATAEAGRAMARQYQVTYERPNVDDNVPAVEMSVGDARADISYIAGGVQEGGSSLAPKPTTEAGGFGLLQNNSGKLLAIVATLVAVSLGAYALVMALTKDPSGLQTVLSPYGEGYTGGAPGVADEDDDSALAKSAILQRAVDMTEQFAEKRGFLAKAEAALERANLPLRAAEALFFYAAFVVVIFLLATLLKGLLIGLIAFLLCALVGPGIVNFLAKRRKKKFMSQLPDTLTLLSGTLRAGYSLMQGVEAVAQEVEEPMGAELRRVCTEARLGRPLEEALDASAERMDCPDFTWAVMAIRIQREVGGNLAELLLTVADTMTQRERLRRDVSALTAEGRMSAIVLGILPPALAVVMWVVNPDYIGKLFNTTIGNMMLGAAILLALFGFWWMKKTIEIEI